MMTRSLIMNDNIGNGDDHCDGDADDDGDGNQGADAQVADT